MLQLDHEHGSAQIDGVHRRSIAEELHQQFRVATRAGTDIDSDQRPGGEPISDVEHRFVIGGP
jgi:hypothetical protein